MDQKINAIVSAFFKGNTLTKRGKTYALNTLHTFRNPINSKEMRAAIIEAIANSGFFTDFKDRVDQILHEVIKQFEAEELRKLEAKKKNLIKDFNFRIGYDVETGDEVVYCAETRGLARMHPKAFIASIPREFRGEIHDENEFFRITFDPTRPEPSWSEERPMTTGGKMTIGVMNKYFAPPWRNLDAKPRLHPLLKKFLLNFADKKAREILFGWSQVALTQRAKTMLILVAIPGTGKTFLARLLGKLVGDDYFHGAPNDFFSSRFNGQLEQAMICLVDEGSIGSRSQMNTAKKYVEDTLQIERKGKDADKNVEMRTSFIVTSNNHADFAFTPVERKFTVPDLKNIPMKKFFEKPEWDELEDLLEDDVFLAETYAYFTRYPVEWSARSDYQGDTFWQCVDKGEGLTAKERGIYERLKVMENDFFVSLDFVATSINSEKKGYRVTAKNISDLCEKFLDAGKEIARFDEKGGIATQIGVAPKAIIELEETDDLDFL